MFLKLNRYSKKSGEYYPWIVNTNSIETVNSTTDGTVIIVSSSTEPQKVLESVEQISTIMNGEPYRAFPDWIPSDVMPDENGEYLCKVEVTPLKLYRGKLRPDRYKPSSIIRCVRKYEERQWDLTSNDEIRERLVSWVWMPE